jgi:hypothetical protein
MTNKINNPKTIDANATQSTLMEESEKENGMDRFTDEDINRNPFETLYESVEGLPSVLENGNFLSEGELFTPIDPNFKDYMFRGENGNYELRMFRKIFRFDDTVYNIGEKLIVRKNVGYKLTRKSDNSQMVFIPKYDVIIPVR